MLDDIKSSGHASAELGTLLDKERRSREAILDSLEQQIKKQKESVSEAARGNDRAQEKIRLNNLQIEQYEEIRRQEGKLSKDAIKRIEQLKEQNEILGNIKQTIEGMADSFTNILKMEQKSIVNTKSLYDKTHDYVKAIGSGAMNWKKLGAAMAVGLAAKWIDNVVNLAINLRDAEASFMRATGASKEFASSISNVYESSRLAGVSIEETSAAMQTLFVNFTDFTMASKAEREALAETGAVLAELGVSNESFAKGIQNSTKMFGESAMQAEETQRELVTFAKELGVAPQQLSAQFAGMGSSLAKFGDQGIKAFKDLSHISKITGMEMQKVLQITNKFDTFEGAADQAGKLNAALGGNFVNAMDLMMATDPAERFGMIRDSILDAGLSFDDMSYYQKQFYKDALGLDDVGDLAMMLSGDMDSLTGSVDASAESLIEQKRAAQEVQSLQEQWQMLLASMVPILTPIIDKLSEMVTYLADPKNEEMLLNIGTALMYVSAAVAILAAGTLLAAAPWWAFGAAVSYVAYLFFKKPTASTFLQGLTKIGEAFSFIGEMVSSILPDIGGLDSAMGALSFEMFGKDVGHSNFLEGVEQTGDAFDYAGVSAARMGKAVRGSATAGVRAGVAPPATPTAAPAAMETVVQPIYLNLEGAPLQKFVLKVVGEKIRDINIT